MKVTTYADRLVRACLAISVGLSTALANTCANAAPTFYHLESTIHLPSARPNWDYVTLDEAGSRLFVARRADGAAVVDVKNDRFIKTIEQSENANAIVLVPPHGRGFTINNDGTATIFELGSLKTLDRVSFGEAADTATYDAASDQLVVVMGDSQAIAFLNPLSGALIATLDMQTDKMEAPTPDGTGMVFTALRNEDAIARVDARRHALVARWKTEGCQQPSGLALDASTHRLFAGCRGHGRDPVLAVINSGSGAVITTLEIGRGNDGVIFDAQSRRIFAANGVDANLVIYEQVDADTYRFVEAATTRPYARTMAMDHRNKNVYLVTAQGTVDPSRKWNKGPATFYPNHYFPDTFEVLTYSNR